MDHLVFGVPDLAHGIDLMEHKTGVRARFGGKHPGRGTHNALLSLGGRQYLEIIAIDPEQADAPGLLFPELKGLSQPKLIAWAVAVESVADIAKRAKAANIETIGPLEGSRALGRRQHAHVEDAAELPIRPSKGCRSSSSGRRTPLTLPQSSPSGCRLTSFEIEHTDAKGCAACSWPSAQTRS